MLRNMFQGRYGFDKLSFFLFIFALIFLNMRVLWPLGIILAVYGIYRAFSKNIYLRQRELWAFESFLIKLSTFFRKHFAFLNDFIKKLQNWFKTAGLRWKQRKECVFVHCPGCRRTLRLPRGKGTLMVRCPVCGFQFKKKT